ncbi:MAG: site-specific integrase, partial [Dehalococcoidales bacterium]|nr:site-specific integrase [Dehalococcoidales bacterium]
MQHEVDGFLNFLVVEKGFSPHTVAAYRNDLTQFLDFLVEAESRARAAAVLVSAGNVDSSPNGLEWSSI